MAITPPPALTARHPMARLLQGLVAGANQFADGVTYWREQQEKKKEKEREKPKAGQQASIPPEFQFKPFQSELTKDWLPSFGYLGRSRFRDVEKPTLLAPGPNADEAPENPATSSTSNLLRQQKRKLAGRLGALVGSGEMPRVAGRILSTREMGATAPQVSAGRVMAAVMAETRRFETRFGRPANQTERQLITDRVSELLLGPDARGGDSAVTARV